MNHDSHELTTGQVTAVTNSRLAKSRQSRHSLILRHCSARDLGCSAVNKGAVPRALSPHSGRSPRRTRRKPEPLCGEVKRQNRIILIANALKCEGNRRSKTRSNVDIRQFADHLIFGYQKVFPRGLWIMSLLSTAFSERSLFRCYIAFDR